MSNPAASIPVRGSQESPPIPPAQRCPAPGRRIELRVAGHLSERVRGAFGAAQVVRPGFETAITGVLPDPSHLHDLLARCQDMGLQVVSLRRLPQ